MQKYAIVFIIVSTVVMFVPTVGYSHECKTRKEVAGACFKLKGLLRAYNGNPTFRIWKVGTKKLFGVQGFSDLPDEIPDFPSVLEEQVNKVRSDLVDSKAQISGSYSVCPLSKEKKGRMQFVCIDEARELKTIPW